MTSKHLHIVTHAIPYPVLHGGLTDVYYSLVALHRAGIKIHLHSFVKKQISIPQALKELCVAIHVYKRKPVFKSLTLQSPHIVQSRKSERLAENLLNDDFPILLGGIHCTALLSDKRFAGRKTFVRLYNVENIYYRHLALFEKNIFKKIYYKLESRLLLRYERSVALKTIFIPLSKSDDKLYKQFFGAKAFFIPPFIAYENLNNHTGNGSYCLYHGNLSVSENEKAVQWLLSILDDLKIPLVIAGRNPSSSLKKIVAANENCSLVPNPTDEIMQDMIAKAQINLLPSFNNTGVKLKVINALFNGRHCLVNAAGVSGSGLESLCNIAEDKEDYKRKIEELYTIPVQQKELDERKKVLSTLYDNEKNAANLIALIW
ncbi:MAG: glycosyltransferase [Ferruginibacter sp.]